MISRQKKNRIFENLQKLFENRLKLLLKQFYKGNNTKQTIFQIKKKKTFLITFPLFYIFCSYEKIFRLF